MTTTALTAGISRARRRPHWSLRLVSAEFLKLRKRRGLVLSTIALTVVPILVVETVLAILHAADPAEHGPAGGMGNFPDTMWVLFMLGTVAAILVGATMGTADLGAGVFRELVVTGRSRRALFAARVPAGLALLLPIVGAAYAVLTTATIIFAGSPEVVGREVIDYRAPSASFLISSAGWLARVMALSFALALGVSSLLGSRGTSIAILLGWQIVAMPLLVATSALGSLRDGLVAPAIERVAPTGLFTEGYGVPVSLTVALLVLAGWTAVPLALGAWRTCTRDA
jgi:hypothetical protein